MSIFVDTSVLARLANAADAQHLIAAGAVLKFRRRGELLCIAPQCLTELWGAATRPGSANGLGLPVADADALVTLYLNSFDLLPEIPAIFPAWRLIVTSLGVIGKQVHDARLVATCHVHAVPAVLTFNVGHFARLGAAPPGVAVIDPARV